MASIIGRSAFRASRPMMSTIAATERAQGSAALKKEAKRNPELYILGIVMTGCFAMAGWHFSSNPTGSSSEANVSRVHGSEPWKTGKDSKYQYYPHGDTSASPKDAPSPLNVVIIPNVNLPKDLHEQFNKYGKDGYP